MCVLSNTILAVVTDTPNISNIIPININTNITIDPTIILALGINISESKENVIEIISNIIGLC